MKSFNFNKSITDLFGDPLFDTATVHQLPQPKEMEYLVGGNKTKTGQIQYVIPKDKPMSYQRVIFQSLRQAGNDRGAENFDKDEVGMLMIKMAADTDVKLTVPERNLIIEACKSFADTEAYIQIKQLLDPSEEEPEADEQE